MAEITFPKYLKLYNNLPVEERIEMVNKALTEHPEDEDQLKLILAFLYYSSPSLKDKCIELCDEIIEKSNNDNNIVYAYYFSASLYEDKNDLSEAIRRTKLILEIDAFDNSALTNLIEINFDKKNYDEAKKYAEQLCNVEDFEYLGFFYLGKIARQMKDYDNAIANFKISVSKCEEDLDSSPSYFLSICYAETNQIDKAIEILKEAIKIYPDEAELYYGLGLCLQNKDDFYRALDNYTKALKLQPDFPEAYNNIANLFLNHEGDFKKAAQYLEKALEVTNNAVKPNNVLYFMNLFRIYNSMHDDIKADYYQKKYLACLGFDDSFSDSDDDEEEL